MARILITGMSGVGKSALLDELGRRGHRVQEMDDEGWSVELPTDDGQGMEQLWLADRLAALLAEPSRGDLYVGGCAANQGAFYDRFEAVVLLSVPADVLLARLRTRVSNDFGKAPLERARIVADLAGVEPLLRAAATVELDGRQPVTMLADAVEALARRG